MVGPVGAVSACRATTCHIPHRRVVIFVEAPQRGAGIRTEDEMTQLAFDRLGAGQPLVLLHGLGLSRRSWDPVVTALAQRFDVIAVDLPGFGDSAPLPAEVEPTPAALAAAVDRLLDGLGINRPHVVGNSLGGWVALELAGIRPVASLTLLSPAGLWRDRTPMYARASLLASRWLAHHLGGLLSWLARYRAARVLIHGQTHGKPTQLTADQARTTIRELGQCPGFNATLAATRRRRYEAGSAVDAPVTLAFGSRDLILLQRQSRHIDQLPPGTQVQELRGCGHVPMSDDPNAVVALITATVAMTAESKTSAR
jgi:pimeloyl-ACP methyl ester carboxylesterase